MFRVLGLRALGFEGLVLGRRRVPETMKSHVFIAMSSLDISCFLKAIQRQFCIFLFPNNLLCAFGWGRGLAVSFLTPAATVVNKQNSRT